MKHLHFQWESLLRIKLKKYNVQLLLWEFQEMNVITIT